MKKHANIIKMSSKAVLIVLCALLVGCELYGTYPDGSMVVVNDSAPPVVVNTVDSVPLLGTIALTAFAPVDSLYTAETTSALITVRSGSAFGPVVIEPTSFLFDESAVLSVDVVDLPYGYYDVEMVGLDSFGNNVSYAASGLTLNEPIESLSLVLETVSFSGDVYLSITEPLWDPATNPVDSIEYTLWDRDPITGELTFVEFVSGLYYDGWSMQLIPELEFGEYRIEVNGFDLFGIQTVTFAGDFQHLEPDTQVSVDFWYTW